jgi:uncharacterized protein
MTSAHTLWMAMVMCGVAMARMAPGAAAEREVRFVSHGAELAGTVVFPRGRETVAAVVYVAGSGMQPRDAALARRFASEGIAALTYDKRGVGKSGGVFVSQRSISERNFNLLADDAAAAVDFLSAQPEVARVPVGLVGFSQAGYLAPLAAARNRKVKFLGLWSGPVCKASEEDIYSVYTSDRDFRVPPTFEEVRALREQPYEWDEANFGKETDVSESLQVLTIPGLWIFGGRDGSIPVDLSISRLRRHQRLGHGAYEFMLFSQLGHDTQGGSFSTMVEWLRAGAAAGFSARRTTPSAADLSQYAGKYVSAAPPLELEVTARGATLFATAGRGPLAFDYVGPNSFMAHDPGTGYAFLDFDPDRRRVRLSQAGTTVVLEKRLR